MHRDFKEDTRLARDLLAGSEKAFSEFVAAYHSRLSRYSFLICGHREDAEEVAQETLLKVFESIDQLRDPGRLKAWVFRIAKNECLMKRRKSIFAPKAELSLDELRPKRSGDGEQAVEIADWSRLPDRLVFDSELRNALIAGIRQLPEIYRAVVLLRDVEELTTEEAADVLEVNPDIVKTRLHRGRLALRQHLDPYLRNTPGDAKHD